MSFFSADESLPMISWEIDSPSHPWHDPVRHTAPPPRACGLRPPGAAVRCADGHLLALGSRVHVKLAFATGDNGPWKESGKKDKRFVVQWPASSPYTVGVGGTEFGACGAVGGEVAVWVDSPCNGADNADQPGAKNMNGYSGGGFSNVYGPLAKMSCGKR